MNDRRMHEAALVRQGRAQRRKARALDRRRQAELKAEAAMDPKVVRRLRREAELHNRAAGLHERAMASQAEHARAHEVNATNA
jgi:hypothetical protein